MLHVVRTARNLAATAVLIISTTGFSHAADVREPKADSATIVKTGNVRFTVLTSRLLRLEWAADGAFEDHASLVFLHRRLAAPPFSVHHAGEWLEITTDSLTLRYKENSGRFSPGNMSIDVRLNGRTVNWQPGMKDTANLMGTTRTLDGVEGATPLEPGLLSRDGWVLVDDTGRPLFDTSAWPWVLPRPAGERQDWYFFGYGHAYKDALGDFIKVAGKIPMPPRFAFGTWWSRYWAYTDREFEDLVEEFRKHSVPLDVLVVDMDWHLTFNQRWSRDVRDQAGQTLGWTGYTWDPAYFPDPDAFLHWCEAHGLQTTLNVHPASGIQPHEEPYPAMARAMGIDPATKKYIPFDIVDKTFAGNYFEQVIHPLERRGIDFWWLDWQQWGTTKIPGVTPTWWLNYVFFTDMERRNTTRPLLFHRWGGLGNHRYQVGFSGDVISVWKSLAFQPYFTATAANVGFGYWSHDIGGHMPGVVSPELYTRWIQFGAFSPILRTHTTKNPDAERRLWAYPDEYFRIMREAYRLRYALIPYLYTSSRHTYESGVSIVHPLYYEHPEAPEAYTFSDEYYFGNDMIVAPIATPVDAASRVAARRVWLPPGEWIEWSTGAFLNGPATLERTFALEETPVYLRAGSIIPMQPDMMYTGEKPVDPLILNVFPGADGATGVYEDEGNSLGYQQGEYALTAVKSHIAGDGSIVVLIGPRGGAYAGMAESRAYEIRCALTWPPASVECNGVRLPWHSAGDSTGWSYDGDHMTVVIHVPRTPKTQQVEVTLRASTLPVPSLTGVPGTLSRLHRAMALLNNQWPKEWSPEDLILAVQTGNRISLQPAEAAQEIILLKSRAETTLRKLDTMEISGDVRTKARLYIESALQLMK
jgi:alpha-glucosidase